VSPERIEKTVKWLEKGITALADQGLVGASGLVVNVLLARWLAPEQYGSYALAFSIFLLVAGFYNALLLAPMAVFGSTSYKNCLPEYLGKLLRLHLVLTFPLALILIMVGTALRSVPASGFLGAALCGAGLAMPFTMFFWLWRQASYVDLRPKLALRGSAAYLPTTAVLIFALKGFGLLSAFTAFLSLAVAGIVAGVILIASVKPRFNASSLLDARSILKQHWHYGRWVFATGFVSWLSVGAYFFLVGALLRIEDVAALRALQNFALPMPQLVSTMTLLLLPWASHLFATQGGAALHRSIKKLSLLFSGVGGLYLIALLFFGRPLMEVTYRGQYMGFAFLLPFMVLPFVLMGAAEAFGVGMRAMQAPSEVFWGYALAGGFTLVAGPAFIHFWGLPGAVVSMSISSVAFFIFMNYRYRATLQRHAGREPIAKPLTFSAGVRVAWLTPTLRGGDYMQPLFRELTRILPNTVIFTADWPGVVAGYNHGFQVKKLSGYRFITTKRNPAGYDKGFILAPASVLAEMFRFRPDVIVVGNFGIWTFCALLSKVFVRSRIIFLCDGISPALSYVNAPVRLMSRRIMGRFFDACLSNTEEGAAYLRDAVAIPASKITRHPFQVADPELLGSAGVNANGLKTLAYPRFLYVGQLIARKGVERLLQACSLLKQRGMGGFSLVIVGEGAEGDKLRQLAHELGLDGLVHWVGGVQYEQLGAYYRACDVFVLPTLEDIWAVVVLEAMAFGKPILCSKYAGAKEMVMEGENGFVFDPYEPEKLAELMGRLIREPELIEKLGAKSREIVAPYSPQEAANVLASVVSNILWRVPRARPQIEPTYATQEQPEAAAFEVK
jgi:glycosyltransferase involved in cell wall biosynthesis